MADDDESDVLLAASDDGKSDWMQRDAGLTLVEEFSEFSRETRRCCGERRLEGYTDWRGVSRQEELLSDMGPMVLARRVDKGTNRCTEVRKASAGVPGGSGVVQRAQGDALGYLCAQGRRDGATTTRKVTYFAAHPGGVCGDPRWGVQGTSSYGRAGSEAVRKDNLKTSDYPPVGWRGRLLSPAHLDESKSSSQAQARLEFIWSVHVTVKLSSYLELLESLYLFVFLDRLG
ncbi:hypothetical protein Acr_26g0007910 [Actinidia rufa]|uniref:Uncharacterized protein n=1 Tax=Actinidia rufa TaxID=165716 RepID=A0A7J0H3F1_9ERIC|nr:hypothetical protein Acr_26g0007910 [Actinidia rufa]